MNNPTEQNKQHFWDIREENGLLHLLDPDKNMHAYVKWDGEIHIWYYDDNKIGFDHDTGLEDHTDWGFVGKSHHDYYDMFDIDEQIARLQSLRETAAKWFAEHQKKRWPPDWENYRTGKIDIEQAQALPPQVAVREYTDCHTGISLTVECDIPEHPKFTFSYSKENSIKDTNAAIHRLLTSAQADLQAIIPQPSRLLVWDGKEPLRPENIKDY